MARKATARKAAKRKATKPKPKAGMVEGKALPQGGTSTKSALAVAILSAHPLVLDNLKSLLDTANFRVEAQRIEYLPGQGGEQAALPFAKVFVVDANGPSRAVAGLVARVKSEQPESSLVVVGDEFSEDAAFPLLRMGIRGMIRYADAPGQLQAAVESVGGGGYWVPRLLLSKFVFAILEHSRPAVPGEPRRLSPRETQVYDALLENLSNKEIASRMGISERTVKFHVSSVLAKHRVQRRADLILQNFHARPTSS
jgi:DNA-binding NarL/FixJ family response regulator